jgi:hypothetical protein
MPFERVIFYSCAVGIGVAGTSTVLLLLWAAEEFYGRVVGRMNLVKKLKRKEKTSKNLVEYLVELRQVAEKKRELSNMVVVSLLAGALVAFIVPGTVARIVGFIAGVMLGMVLNLFMKHYQRSVTRVKKLKEAVLIYDTIDIYTEAGESLPVALSKILPALDALKLPVERFIKRYPYGSGEAIMQLEEDMDFDEAGSLTSVMLQVIKAGSTEGISSAEGVRMENIRKTLHRANIAVRPIYRQIVLFLPLGLALTLVLYVLGKHAVESIMFMNATQYL